MLSMQKNLGINLNVLWYFRVLSLKIPIDWIMNFVTRFTAIK